MIGYDIGARLTRPEHGAEHNMGFGAWVSKNHAASDQREADGSRDAGHYSALQQGYDSEGDGAVNLGPGLPISSAIDARSTVFTAQESGLRIVDNFNDAVSSILDEDKRQSGINNNGGVSFDGNAAGLGDVRFQAESLNLFQGLSPNMVSDSDNGNQAITEIPASGRNDASHANLANQQDILEYGRHGANSYFGGPYGGRDSGDIYLERFGKPDDLSEYPITKSDGAMSDSIILPPIIPSRTGLNVRDERARAAVFGTDGRMWGADTFFTDRDPFLDTSKTPPWAVYDPSEDSENHGYIDPANNSEWPDVKTISRRLTPNNGMSNTFSFNDSNSDILTLNSSFGHIVRSESQTSDSKVGFSEADGQIAAWNAYLATLESSAGSQASFDRQEQTESGADLNKYGLSAGDDSSSALAGLWGVLNHAERSLPKVGSTDVDSESGAATGVISDTIKVPPGFVSAGSRYHLDMGMSPSTDEKSGSMGRQNGPSGHKNDPIYIIAVSAMGRTLMPTVPTPGTSTRTPPIPGQRNLA